MVPTSPPIGAPPEDAFLKAAGPNVDPDDNQRVATEEASISEQTVAIPDVDIEDDQRGAQDVFDETRASGAAAGVSRELVQTFKTIFIYNGDQFNQDLSTSDGSYSHFPPSSPDSPETCQIHSRSVILCKSHIPWNTSQRYRVISQNEDVILTLRS